MAKKPVEYQEYKKEGNKFGFFIGILVIIGFTFAGIGIVAARDSIMLFLFNLIFVLMFGALTILFAIKTNAWSELITSFRGTPLIKLYRRDGTVQNVACKLKAGMAETKDSGRFIVTPGSVYRNKKTGLIELAAFADYGVTVNPNFPMVASRLKKEGLENITEAEAYNKKMVKEEKRSIAIPIPFMETVKFDDIIGFFKYNVSPHYIAAAVERRVTIALQGTRQIPIAWISVMAVLFVAAALAYMMIAQGGGTQIIERIVPAAPAALVG